MTAIGGITAILGLIGAVTGFLRDWKTAPKLVMTSIAIVGAGLAAIPPVTQSSGSGSLPPASPVSPSDPSTPSVPSKGATPTVPSDPTDSEEYQDCSRSSAYSAAGCEVLRDEANGEQARSFYRSCRESGYEPAYCLEAMQE